MKNKKKISESQLKRIKNKSKEGRHDKLYQETLKLQREANQRLKSLSRHRKVDTWAGRELRDRLDKSTIKAWHNNRVSISKDMNITQLSNIHKSITKFLRMPTSTQAGINEQKRRTLKGIKNFADVSDKDAENLYRLLFGQISLTDLIEPSELIILCIEAREQNDSQDDFLRRIQSYLANPDIKDEDIIISVRHIYNNFVLS